MLLRPTVLHGLLPGDATPLDGIPDDGMKAANGRCRPICPPMVMDGGRCWYVRGECLSVQLLLDSLSGRPLCIAASRSPTARQVVTWFTRKRSTPKIHHHGRRRGSKKAQVVSWLCAGPNHASDRFSLFSHATRASTKNNETETRSTSHFLGARTTRGLTPVGAFVRACVARCAAVGSPHHSLPRAERQRARP